jgi:hypothetical protein
MDFLWAVLGVVFVAVVLVLIIYGERSYTTHWVFWVGIGLLVLTFVGVPAAMISMVRKL